MGSIVYPDILSLRSLVFIVAKRKKNLIPTLFESFNVELSRLDKKFQTSQFSFDCELNYHDQKVRRTPTHDIRKYWTAVSTLLSLISSVYGDLHHQRSN